MTSLIASVKDLITSVFEVIFSTIKAAFDTVFSVLNIIISSITSTFGALLNTAQEFLVAAGGVGKFIAGKNPFKCSLTLHDFMGTNNVTKGNIFVLAFVGIGVYGFLNYRSRQGRSVTVGNKKLN